MTSLIVKARKSEQSNSAEQFKSTDGAQSTRRDVLVAPILAMGASFLLSAATRAEDKMPVAQTPSQAEVKTVVDLPASSKPEEQKKEEEDVITSRIYDATVIGEPSAIGKDKWKVWEKLMNARVVYLGEAEQVPVRDDKELELEIVKNLHKRCIESDKRLSLALEAFPSNLQEQLDEFMDKRYVFHVEGKETIYSYRIILVHILCSGFPY